MKEGRLSLRETQEDRVLLPIHNQVLDYAMKEGLDLAVHPENQPRMYELKVGQ